MVYFTTHVLAGYLGAPFCSMISSPFIAWSYLFAGKGTDLFVVHEVHGVDDALLRIS